MTSPQDHVLCVRCLTFYEPEDIIAYLGDTRTSLAVIRSGHFGENRSLWARLLKILRRLLGFAERTYISDSLEVLKNWSFVCPRTHLVDGTSGRTFPLAVVGRSGASKSNFVPAIPWEIKTLGSLDRLEITLLPPIWKLGKVLTDVGSNADPLVDLQDASIATEDDAEEQLSSDLDTQIESIFVRGKVPPPTKANVGVQGPFAYRLAIENGKPRQQNLALYLFDVPGEYFEDLNSIANDSSFILLAQALTVLIDPVGLVPSKTQEDLISPQLQAIALSEAIELITRIADAFKSVFNTRKAEVPICFVLAKADSVSTSYAWERETERIASSGLGELQSTLSEASASSRTAFSELGLDRLLHSIDAQFDQQLTRFAFASATSQEKTPGSGDQADSWDYPIPNGVGITVLHALDLRRVFRTRNVDA